MGKEEIFNNLGLIFQSLFHWVSELSIYELQRIDLYLKKLVQLLCSSANYELLNFIFLIFKNQKINPFLRNIKFINIIMMMFS